MVDTTLVVRLRAVLSCVAVAFAALVTQGCGGSSSSRYTGPWAQATGVVQVDGKPISQAGTITFMSSDGLAVTGKVDSGGTFRLKYNGSNNVPVATFRVGFLPESSAQGMSENPEDYFNADGSTKVAEEPAEIIDPKYHSPSTSGLTVQTAEGSNDLTIDLES